MTTTLWSRIAALRIPLVLASAWLLLAAADGLTQQASSPKRIGVVLFGYAPESDEVQAFPRGLHEAGYVEGRDVTIDWRTADANPDRLSALVAELVTSKVDILVVESTVAALAAKRATTTIPIVRSFYKLMR